MNNYELFSKYALGVRDKLKEKYIVKCNHIRMHREREKQKIIYSENKPTEPPSAQMDVDDFKAVTRNFEDVLALFKKQSERWATLMK